MALTIPSPVTATSTLSNSTLAITGITAAVGDVLLICLAVDNAGTSGAARTISSVADNAGSSTNVYSQRGTTGNQTAGSSNDGASQYFIECPVTTALSSNTITITLSGSASAKAATVYRMQPGAGETVEFVSVDAANAGAARTTHSASTVSVTSGDTIFGAMAMETDNAVTGDSDTTNGSWSTISTDFGAPGPGTSRMTVAAQYKTVNATGNQSWAATTSSSADSVSNTIIYGVVAPAGDTSNFLAMF